MAEITKFDRLELCAAIDLDAQLRHDGVILKQETSGIMGKNGREFSGACPLCKTGDDRFRFWPDRTPARFWCRKCKQGGDAVTYKMERDGWTYKQIIKEYGKSNGAHHGEHQHQPVQPKIARVDPPPADWQNNAMLLVADCETTLWSDQGEKAQAFLHDLRGLRDDTIKAWRLGFCPASGLSE